MFTLLYMVGRKVYTIPSFKSIPEADAFRVEHTNAWVWWVVQEVAVGATRPVVHSGYVV